MPKRDADLLIEDMRDAVHRIERYIAGMSREEFLRDEKTIDAVARNLEILGEAARKLSDEVTSGYPDIPWRQIAGLRNRIVHDYFGLDLEIVWEVVTHSMPELIKALDHLHSTF